jgi:cytoplasmic iron level regulating protein YaaA (DUF328/UPF0246 family)
MDELVAEAEIGDEAKRFLESDLGKTILGIAKLEAEQAVMRLRNVDPDDAKSIRQIQNEIWRAESFEEWLTQLFHNGEQAIELYRQQRDS